MKRDAVIRTMHANKRRDARARLNAQCAGKRGRLAIAYTLCVKLS